MRQNVKRPDDPKLIDGGGSGEDDEWDRQMKADAAAGKFDELNRQATEDLRAGRRPPLEDLL